MSERQPRTCTKPFLIYASVERRVYRTAGNFWANGTSSELCCFVVTPLHQGKKLSSYFALKENSAILGLSSAEVQSLCDAEAAKFHMRTNHVIAALPQSTRLFNALEGNEIVIRLFQK